MEAVLILAVIFSGVIGIVSIPRLIKAKFDPKTQALKALEDRRLRELEGRHSGERKLLEERIEHLETIVTSVDMEFNARMNRLLASEDLRQLSAATGQMPQLRTANPGAVVAPTPGVAGADKTISAASIAPATLPEALTVPPPTGSSFSTGAGGLTPAPAMGSGPSASLSTAATLPTGSVFAARYKILSLLGRGGMGVVYRALDQQLEVDVAIKIANAEFGGDPAILDRLRREAAAARRIAHENVIRVHDLGEYAGRLFISMEYFAGEQLSALVKREGPLRTGRAKEVALKVSSALESAHAAGVVHRDLKPQNLMSDAAGRIKVIDFGIALAPHLHGLTATGLIMGTPEYMSPEQIRGDDIDARTDLYAMGCVIYFLLTGSPPFTADTPIAVGFAHLRRDPTAPSHLRAELSRDWDAVCLRLLAKDKDERFQSAEELGRALGKL